ncbi:MAG: site-2 protease family protein, partial [Rhodospirillales bacterium]|nr:site-2 protease family protein [Rhodospirillales bacterium]
MIDFLRSALGFIVVLGVLVTVHELGHYLVARWRGVTVEAFSLGFGPALFSRTDRHGTVWKISAIPLGGYVRMKGWAEFGAEQAGA